MYETHTSPIHPRCGSLAGHVAFIAIPWSGRMGCFAQYYVKGPAREACRAQRLTSGFAA